VYSGHPFRLTEVGRGRFTVKSDLFDWASLVYQLATGKLPAEEYAAAGGGVREVILGRARRRGFPALPRELMGEIVRKCWMQEYEDAEAVRRDIKAFLKEAGFDVEGDSLKGVDGAQLFPDG
jgi:hypothetical protein